MSLSAIRNVRSETSAGRLPWLARTRTRTWVASELAVQAYWAFPETSIATPAAKSVQLAATVNGEATVALPIGGGTGTPLDLTGTTASADIDFVKPAARATFAVKAGLTLNGEIIAVDGKTYVKSTLTGPLYEESAAGAGLFEPTLIGDLIDNIGDILVRIAPGIIVGVGLTFVIVTGEIDISVGSLMGLLAAILGIISSPERLGWPVPIAIAIALTTNQSAWWIWKTDFASSAMSFSSALHVDT